MTNIVVLIKQVQTPGRSASCPTVTSPRPRRGRRCAGRINERAVEEALLIKEREGDAAGTVTVLTAGPERATEAIRKALSMGADKAVHLLDPGLHGSDMVQTGWALGPARSVRSRGASTWSSPVTRPPTAPAVRFAIIAEYLGLPQLTHLRKVSIEGGKVVGERETDDGVFSPSRHRCPAVISVNEKINEPRLPRPSKGIMAAKKKEVVATLTLAEIGVGADEVGLDNAGSTVVSSTPKAAEDGRREDHRRGRRRQEDRRVPGRPEDYLEPPPLYEQEAEQPMAEVLVLVEHSEGSGEKVTAELITAARASASPPPS